VYTEFFGLNEKPFSISPDPRYLYLSQRHADALAHLIYGISESGGFIQLTGEVGTGKTTLIRSLLEQLPEKAEIALILNPQLSTKEFMQAILSELRIAPPEERTVKGYIDALNEKLLAANAVDQRVVLIVDEAQTLTPELLEQVRLLTNLETAKKKLLQIILIGQPELKQLLDRPEMRQIAQRVTGRYHLEPLSQEDTAVYIGHRMKVAGAHAEVFMPRAVRQIYRLTGGIPRLINVVADRSLLAAYTQECTRIDAQLVKRAAAEVFGRTDRRPWWPWAAAAAGAAVFALSTTVLRDGATPELDTAMAAERDVASVVSSVADPAVSFVADAATATGAPAPPETGSLHELGSPVVAGSRPAPGVLDALLRDDSAALDTSTAMSTLFDLWSIEYVPAAGPACQQARGHALRCLFSSRSSIGELRRRNLPAILTLTDAEGGQHEVVVSGLDYDSAQLRIGDVTKRVGIVELTHYWYGDYLLLWKPIGDAETDLTRGMRSATVAWIRNGLANLRGTEPSGTDSTLYDSELEAWVRDYQRARRLGVDGVVGTQTQIALQLDLGVAGIPQLGKDF
jgi:general secretion pathway protein A